MSNRYRDVASRLALISAHLTQRTSTCSPLNGPMPIFQKCRGYSPIASTLPAVVHHKKDVGDIIIRPMTQDDITGINELIRSRHRIDFAESDLYAVFQSPKFLGLVATNEANEIVAYVGGIKQTTTIWSLGLSISAEKYRRMGIMSDIACYGIKYCVNESGFLNLGYGYAHLEGYYRSVFMYFDMSFGKFFRLLGEFDKSYIAEKVEFGVEIVNIDVNNFVQVSCYDEGIHVLPRKEILYAMCFNPTTKAYAAIREGKITGYALLQKCHGCYKIAPLFADNPSIAQLLYQKLAKDIPLNNRVSTIMTSNCDYTDTFIKRNNFKVVATLYRQLSIENRQFPFAIPFQKVFSLTDTQYGIC